MKRHLLRHFVNIGDGASLSDTDYHLIGEGVASLSEEMNAEEETNQWINQENGTTNLKSYTPSISIEMQDVGQDDTDLIDWINNLVDTLPTGNDAITSYVRVRVKGSGPSYPAVQRMCTVTVGSTGGDAGSNVTNTITLGGRGDGIQGTFDIATMKFTPKGNASEPAAFSARKALTNTEKSSLS